MAEGLLKHVYGDRYEVFSAGANPIDRYRPKSKREPLYDTFKKCEKSVSIHYLNPRGSLEVG